MVNDPRPPSIELIQGLPGNHPVGPPARRRWPLFFAVLFIAAAVGALIVYAREPVYRATATVLTVQPKSIDRSSASADVEHVAIQGRRLLGDELLGRLLADLREQERVGPADIDALRAMLSAVAVPDTNLLELRAEGNDPELLQTIVNRWVESYQTFRATDSEAATGRTTAEIDDRQQQLAAKIDAARGELAAFREVNDIVGVERGENAALARLNGTNESLNRARERLVGALARQQSVEQTIGRDEVVAPREQKKEIARLEGEIQRREARLAKLREKYTQAYLDRDPKLKALPDELRELQQELAGSKALIWKTMREEARQEAEAAQIAVDKLERQLAEQQRAMLGFDERYRAYTVLDDELKRLERLQAENTERLAQIELRNLQKFPPIQVIEWSLLPNRPIHPDYQRDLVIALGAALATALFVTWLVEYLGGRDRQPPPAPYVGVRVYHADSALPGASSGAAALDQAPPAARIAATVPAGLPALPRELAGTEVQTLLGAAEPLVGGYATLLLSGISPYELPLLHRECFVRDSQSIIVPGAGARAFPLAPGAWRRLEPLLDLLDGARMPLTVAELDRHLAELATRSGLSDPGSINALALWHTYVVHLARQGTDQTTLGERVGTLSGEMLSALRTYAPPGEPRPIDAIAFTYPALDY